MTDASAIRVLVADDHALVREGLSSLIAKQKDMTVVAEAASGVEAIAAFRRHRPDVSVVDLRMPGLGGIEAIRALCQESPHARIVVVSSYVGDEDIQRALEAGARAYIPKTAPRHVVLEAIRAVHSGKRYIPPEVASRLVERIQLADLTSREIQVLELMATGMTNKEIARALDLSQNTVRNHVAGLFQKLEVNDRVEAVTQAIERGLIHLDSG